MAAAAFAEAVSRSGASSYLFRLWLTDDLVRKLDGLMLPVVAITKYMSLAYFPHKALLELLSNIDDQQLSKLSPEERLDQVYGCIFLQLGWFELKEDPCAYKMVIGAIHAAKSPLSEQSIGELYSATHLEWAKHGITGLSAFQLKATRASQFKFSTPHCSTS